MHENTKICLKYMFKMRHGANININKQNGTKPNQQNRKKLQEIKISQPKTKINPNHRF